MNLIKGLLLVVFPPLGVLLHKGLSGTLVINIILTMLGYIPGLIHGIYLFLANEDIEPIEEE